MKPEISVVIPTYNRKHVVGEAIESALMQEPKNFEVIVVDDGSTDDTAAFVQSQYPSVRVIESENRGVSHARNLGIRAVLGNYVAFLDSDDLWLAGKLERQHEYLRANPNIPLVYTDEKIEAEGSILPETRFELCPPKTKFTLPYVLMGAAIHSSAVMVKKEIFDAVGMFEEDLTMHEDSDMWDRICNVTDVGYIEEPLAIWRWKKDPNHLSISDKDSYLKNTKLYLQRYLERRGNRQLLKSEQYAIEDTYKHLDIIERN